MIKDVKVAIVAEARVADPLPPPQTPEQRFCEAAIQAGFNGPQVDFLQQIAFELMAEIRKKL